MSETTATPAGAPTGGPAAPAQWDSAPAPVPSHAWRALIVLLIGMFMALLDTTIVNVALPTIRDNVNASGTPAGEDVLSWIISGYALAFGIALIPAGRIGDRIGHKWVFFTGLALFTVASLACGLAQSDTQLIIARVVQGLAGGIFVPAVTAYIQLLFPPRSRGRAFAIMGAVIGVSSALGPILGGLIIQGFGDQNGWRLVFGVNLPIGVVALVAAIVLLPGAAASGIDRTRSSGGVDWVGLVLLTGGLVALLVPLIEGENQGWPLWTYLVLALGVLLLVLFGVWEVLYSRRGRSPLVPPKLFTHPAFTGGTILALVYFAAFTSIFFTIALFWQAGLGHTALESGLVATPFAVGSIIGSSQSNRLANRLGRTVLLIGTSLLTVGLLAVWVILLRVAPTDLSNWDLLAPLFIAGVGNGLFIAPNAQFIVATVDRAEAGAASGVISTVQRIGSAIGIAVIGSVLFSVADLGTVRSKADLATHFANGSTAALGVSVAFSVLALLLVFALPKRVSQWG
ncbi:MFS transporter [Galbitalea soli]|uniref:MFS transporter n=1 Tax=Galbitalea soli TaxID=1268042 RepID=A0A7C9TPT8_9MICO|nr:MFS transporter [Galbitalea soli]NEM90499.1 MFS transporter [Galbitalea soli]NYJ31212.1 EmrB/QacA subfamily drug resistance transporter [Galbitalea soli]